MEFLNTNGLLILVILSSILIVLITIIIINTFRLNEKLLSNRLEFSTILENNIETGKNNISIIVVNQSLVDVSITSLGIINQNKYFDFIKNYIATENIAGERVVIPQRASIKLELDYDVVEDIIINNSEIKKFKKLLVYAIAKSGYISKAKAKSVRYILQKKWQQITHDKIEKAKIEKQDKKRIEIEKFKEAYNSKAINKEKISLIDRIKAKYYDIFYKK